LSSKNSKLGATEHTALLPPGVLQELKSQRTALGLEELSTMDLSEHSEAHDRDADDNNGDDTSPVNKYQKKYMTYGY
jgi:hypothetical protein